jgi:DNA-binding response OmpR family regulator
LATTSSDNGVAMPEATVLIVDDEPLVREILCRYLTREGFAVDTASDGQQALDRWQAGHPDLVLLDLMLPKVSGLDVFRRVRETDNAPVIMLTAKGEEADRLVGLEIGADDYVTKPFSPREVVARVRAVLRRSGPNGTEHATQPVLRYGDICVDARRREVRLADQPVSLTRREYELLLLLAANPGTAFSRAELLERVWDFAWAGDSSTVTVHIRRLREKLEADPSSPRHLLTVWGVGYRFDP